MKANIILLPTKDEKANIVKSDIINNLYLRESWTGEGTKHHLYIYLDNQIQQLKEWDWIYEDNLNNESHIYQIKKRNGELGFFRFENVFIYLTSMHNAKKIIATTDETLLNKKKSATEYTEDRSRTFYAKNNLLYISFFDVVVFIYKYNREKMNLIPIEVDWSNVLTPLGPTKPMINYKFRKLVYSEVEMLEILRRFEFETSQKYTRDRYCNDINICEEFIKENF